MSRLVRSDTGLGRTGLYGLNTRSMHMWSHVKAGQIRHLVRQDRVVCLKYTEYGHYAHMESTPAYLNKLLACHPKYEK